jgi:glycosyltransferase involved in cell wall biosynthesis
LAAFHTVEKISAPESSTGISVVIPYLNESEYLRQFLAHLDMLDKKPTEIIFVDAGSEDSSTAIVREWINLPQRKETCRIIFAPEAFPGAARNAGVRVSSMKLIAFLDVGVYPDAQWLSQMFHEISCDSSILGVLGDCLFRPDVTDNLGVITCALTNGVGSSHPTIPGSIWNRRVFAQVGLFDEDLRSAEDLAWVQRIRRCGLEFKTCGFKNVVYRHYPPTLKCIFWKWVLADRDAALAGVKVINHVVLSLALALLIGLALGAPQLCFAYLGCYYGCRGVIHPVLKSDTKRWWGIRTELVVMTPFVAVIIDSAKCVGATWGYGLRFWFKVRKLIAAL